ncbi:MAG: DUF3100 domain-containing protein [Pseudomonadota bacterium]
MSRTPIWIIALTIAAAVTVGQMIGFQTFELGLIKVTLPPLIFAFFFGLLFNPAIIPPLSRLIGPGAGQRSAQLVGPAVMPVIVILTAGIGSSFDKLLGLAPALFAQEFGNMGTMLIAMPVAVLLFRMGRESIGATFSIAREGGIAFIFDKYGANTPEATGIMGVYICGTFFGTIMFAVMPPLVASMGVFDINALAMACGNGSGSMMAACAASLEASLAAPGDNLIEELAAASNLASGVSNLFVIIFITIPLAEIYFRTLSNIRQPIAASGLQIGGFGDEGGEDVAVPSSRVEQFIRDIRLSLIAICAAAFAHLVVGLGSIELVYGLATIFVMTVIGYGLARLFPLKILPDLFWISMVAMIACWPGVPGSETIRDLIDPVSFMAAITALMAFAAIGISGREVSLFKRFGLQFVVVAFFVFFGTFMGSAVIAEAVIRFTPPL